MRRLTTRMALVGALAVALVLVTGTAIAATGGAGASPGGFLDSLASHLGISRDKLDDAVQAASIDQVEAALAAGTITQEQADELKSRIESGALPAFGFGGRGFGHGHGMHVGLGDRLEAAATYLGLTEAELRSQLADGKSLKEIAEAKGKTVAGLKQALVAAIKADLAEAVEDGKLTEAQATEILTRYTERLDDMIAGTFAGPGHGPGGLGPSHGMHGPGAFGEPSASRLIAPGWGAPA